MYRNTAATLKVFAFNRITNVPATGIANTITCKVVVNGGAAAPLADTNPTEVEDGYYLFDVLASENNGVTADFFPESSASDIQVIPVEHKRYLLETVSGTGARTVTITVRDPDTDPVEAATVRVERSGESLALVTNASGVVVFSLNDATWTVSITATGFQFSPATLVVDGNETVTYTLTATGGGVSPSAPPLTTGFWVVYDLNGVAQSGAQVTIRAASAPAGSTGLVMEDSPRTGTADTDGIIQFSNLVKGATYRVYRTGSTRYYNVTVPLTAGTSVALGSIVG